MIDIGVNLLNGQYQADRDAVLDRAIAAGVEQLVISASDVGESERAEAYCNSVPQSLACTAGVHPHAADGIANTADSAWLNTLAELSKSLSVVAMGEMGLDYHRNYSEPEQQRRVLAAQLELAVDLQMPVFAHDRDAAADMRTLIHASGIDPSRIVIHCFTGDADALQQYLALGCSIGITGWVCDRKRGGRLRELVSLIPLTRLLIESDGPYLRPQNAPASALRPTPTEADPAPKKLSSRRNEPALLPYVVAELAKSRNEPAARIVEASSNNARALFPKLQQLPALTAPMQEATT